MKSTTPAFFHRQNTPRSCSPHDTRLQNIVDHDCVCSLQSVVFIPHCSVSPIDFGVNGHPTWVINLGFLPGMHTRGQSPMMGVMVNTSSNVARRLSLCGPGPAEAIAGRRTACVRPRGRGNTDTVTFHDWIQDSDRIARGCVNGAFCRAQTRPVGTPGIDFVSLVSGSTKCGAVAS